VPRKVRELPWLETRDGVYYAFWYDSQRRRTERLSLRTSDPDEAKMRFAAFLTEGSGVYAKPHSGGGLTCGAVLDIYSRKRVEPEDGSRGVVDTERKTYEIAMLKRYFGPLALSEVTIDHCRDYAAQRMDGRLVALTRHGQHPRLAKPATVRKELGTLKAALKVAFKWRKETGLKFEDIPEIELPQVVTKTKALWLSYDELARLRTAAAGSRTGDFIEIAYYTAARAESIETLTWLQVDLDRQRVQLSKTGERETKKHRPIIPIDQKLMPTLKRLYDEKSTEWVLGTPKPIDPGFKWFAHKAGLEWLEASEMRPAGHLSPHVLRHTRASHLLMEGVDLYAVARLLGDTVQTVERVYGHFCPDYMAAALAARKKEVLLE